MVREEPVGRRQQLSPALVAPPGRRDPAPQSAGARKMLPAGPVTSGALAPVREQT